MCCRRRLSCSCIFVKTFLIVALISLVFLAYKKPAWRPVPSLSRLTSLLTKKRERKSSFTVYHGPSFPLDKVKPIKLPSEEKEVLLKNPPAVLTTSIPDSMPNRDIDKAYARGGEFFWGKTVKAGDYVEMIFVKAVRLRRVSITSGGPDHEDDRFLDTSFQISTTYNHRCDSKAVKEFNDSHVINYEFEGPPPLVHCIRVVIKNVRIDNLGRPRWLIIRDIAIN